LINKLTLATAASIAAATPAYATDWTILMKDEAACRSAREMVAQGERNDYMASPAEDERILRMVGNFGGKQLTRIPGGGEMIEVAASSGESLAFFTTRAACQTILQYLMTIGVIIDPKRLR
jgi:hypothetical protein